MKQPALCSGEGASGGGGGGHVESLEVQCNVLVYSRVRDPVTLGDVDVDVRLQLAAQPAARPLDPAAAESGLTDRHPSLAC
jgi:hypothetical protein